MYKIVFENEHFVICDKAPMVLSVPARTGEADPRPVLGKQLERDLGVTIYPVHRLDYEVQGLIVFAKNPQAHKIGNYWFENKEVTKTYIAHSKRDESAESKEKIFTKGQELNWSCLLLKGKKRAYESPVGKKALTKAVLVNIENEIYTWHLNPITGRSHQLRFELSRHGHPIIGDSLYGAKEVFESGAIALRAFKLDFSKASRASDFGLPEAVLTSTDSHRVESQKE